MTATTKQMKKEDKILSNMMSWDNMITFMKDEGMDIDILGDYAVRENVKPKEMKKWLTTCFMEWNLSKIENC